MGEVEAEADVVEFERELIGVEIGSELALRNRFRGDAGNAIEPRLLFLDEVVAQLAGSVIELRRCAEQRTAASAPLFGRPLEPQREQPPQPIDAAGLAQSRK